MATYTGLVRVMPGVMRLTKDYVNGFYDPGTIGPFTVKTQTAPTVEVPTYCRVILLRDIDLVAVRSMFTNPVTGVYQFDQIDKHLSYTVIAVHPLLSYRAVVADGIYPT